MASSAVGFNFINPSLITYGVRVASGLSIATGVLFSSTSFPLHLKKYVCISSYVSPYGLESKFWTGAANGAFYSLTMFCVIFIKDIITKDDPAKYLVLGNLLIGYTLAFSVMHSAKRYFGN